jgi:hypothetical protein
MTKSRLLTSRVASYYICLRSLWSDGHPYMCILVVKHTCLRNVALILCVERRDKRAVGSNNQSILSFLSILSLAGMNVFINVNSTYK